MPPASGHVVRLDRVGTMTASWFVLQGLTGRDGHLRDL